MSLSTHDALRSPPEPGRSAEPRTVIVGYDGSEEARAAFAVAIDQARPSDSIVVVHAIQPASS